MLWTKNSHNCRKVGFSLELIWTANYVHFCPRKNTGKKLMTEGNNQTFEKLPDHLLIEIFVRVPIWEWAQVSCVNKQWADLFRGEGLWQIAISRTWPSASNKKRWPGPIPRGVARRCVLLENLSRSFLC